MKIGLVSLLDTNGAWLFNKVCMYLGTFTFCRYFSISEKKGADVVGGSRSLALRNGCLFNRRAVPTTSIWRRRWAWEIRSPICEFKLISRKETVGRLRDFRGLSLPSFLSMRTKKLTHIACLDEWVNTTRLVRINGKGNVGCRKWVDNNLNVRRKCTRKRPLNWGPYWLAQPPWIRPHQHGSSSRQGDVKWHKLQSDSWMLFYCYQKIFWHFHWLKNCTYSEVEKVWDFCRSIFQ